MKKLVIIIIICCFYSSVQANQVDTAIYTAKEVVSNYRFYENTTNGQYFPYRVVIKNSLLTNTEFNNYNGIYQDFKDNNINTGTIDYLKNILDNIIQ